MADEDRVVAETRHWIEQVVVGLDLCPFAAQPLREGRVRFFVSRARTPEALADDLSGELARLTAESPEILETTLVIHPEVLSDFEGCNQFLEVADFLLERLDLVGEIQIASFHPDYRFASASPDDAANETNRSPFPMLHLLREASVSRAVESHPDAAGIPAANAERLRALGRAAVRARLRLPGRPPA